MSDAPVANRKRSNPPRASNALSYSGWRALQRRNELARYFKASIEQGLDFGQPHGWAAVVANLAAFVPPSRCDMASARELIRYIGLPPIEDDILVRFVIDTAYSAEVQGKRFKPMTPAAVGEFIQLTSAMRRELEIVTIDAVDEPKNDREARRSRERSAKKRLRRGAKPQAQSAERTEIWLRYGLKRSTYYTRKRENCLPDLIETDSAPHLEFETVSTPLLLSSYVSSWGAEQSNISSNTSETQSTVQGKGAFNAPPASPLPPRAPANWLLAKVAREIGISVEQVRALL